MYLAQIALTEIRPPAHAVRAEIDDVMLEELTQDVKRNGILLPPHVKPVAGGYEIVAGHRRYLAAIGADLASMKCLVVEGEEADNDVIKLTENLYRQELSPVEEAGFFAELFGSLGQDVDRVAARCGKTRAYVESRLLLLSGDGDVLRHLARKVLTLGVAQELNKIADAEKRAYYLRWAVEQGATTKLVRFWREAANAHCDAEASPAPAVPSAAAGAVAPGDPYQCFCCGEKEPVYDLQPLMMHRGCRAVIERAAHLGQEEP